MREAPPKVPQPRIQRVTQRHVISGPRRLAPVVLPECRLNRVIVQILRLDVQVQAFLRPVLACADALRIVVLLTVRPGLGLAEAHLQVKLELLARLCERHAGVRRQHRVRNGDTAFGQGLHDIRGFSHADATRVMLAPPPLIPERRRIVNTNLRVAGEIDPYAITTRPQRRQVQICA
jgi:hypothetical protein